MLVKPFIGWVGFKLTDGVAGDRWGQVLVWDTVCIALFTGHITEVSTGHSKTVRDWSSHCPTELKAHTHTQRSPSSPAPTPCHVCWYTPASPRAGACSAAASPRSVALAGIQSQLWPQLTALLPWVTKGCNRESQRRGEGGRSKWGGEGETGERGASPFCSSESHVMSPVVVFVCLRTEQHWSRAACSHSEQICRSAGAWLKRILRSSRITRDFYQPLLATCRNCTTDQTCIPCTSVWHNPWQ